MARDSTFRALSALVLGSFLGLSGCARSAAEAPAAAPPVVTVSYPVERQVTDFADYTGRVIAVESVEVRARVTGYLAKVNFKEGALVKQGDVLFEIDPRPYQAQVHSALGQIAANEAVLKRAKADNARNKLIAEKSRGNVSQQATMAELVPPVLLQLSIWAYLPARKRELIDGANRRAIEAIVSDTLKVQDAIIIGLIDFGIPFHSCPLLSSQPTSNAMSGHSFHWRMIGSM
jgi:hypothetical protein